MKITDIKRQKRRQDRFNIYVDGKYGFALSELDVLKSRIEIGKELKNEEIENLKCDDERAKVMNKAFVYLARRNHAEKELKSKLLKKFPKGALVEKTIERLKELGYINDEKFVREWIEYRLNTKPRGRILIKRELLTKGVNIELVEKILDLVYNRDIERKELVNLLDLRRKRYSQNKKGRNKLISYLLRRGFLWEDIRDLMESEENS
ncbi:MAG: regulatory protein RecX [Candidatus Berkelbacteria bacterium]|nr:regulatory protein RecX [Candidatus Berkelbacteria bacterium]